MTVVVQVVSIYPTQETYPLIEPYDHHLYLEEHGYNPYHGREVVDSKGRYILEWFVNYKTKMITFKITIGQYFKYSNVQLFQKSFL